MSVAYQGAPGAFGHEACLAFLPEHRPVAKPSFAEVIEAVETEETELGLLPVENVSAGTVSEAQALIEGSGLKVVAEHWLAVRMHLLALPGVNLEEVRTVASHPVALKQCAASLEALGVEVEAAPNTAVAAQRLSDRSRAVLASEAAAAAYGLTILRRDVHDRPDNATRFAVLARKGR
jgi:prephenate dehydratase